MQMQRVSVFFNQEECIDAVMDLSNSGIDARIVFVGEYDPNDKLLSSTYIHFPALLPPVEASYYEVNGDINEYMRIYESHFVNSEDARLCMVEILSMLHDDIAVVMYIQNGQFSNIGRVLPMFLNKYFGINSPIIQPMQMQNIGNLLYSHGNGLINAYEYLNSLDPNNMVINPVCAQRLIIDFDLPPNTDVNKIAMNHISNTTMHNRVSAIMFIDEEEE